MDKRKLMLLLGAVLVALVSAVAVRSLMSTHAAPAVQAAVVVPTGPRVLVAQRALPVGTIITPDAVAFQQWPKDLVRDAYFLDGATDKAKLIGTVVRNSITAGQPLTQGALVAPGDRGFLAAALSPGMRAVTIPVSDMSGVAGFIFPGDHVDMMLTQTIKSSNLQTSTALPLSLTETVLRNLRVLATDQTTETEISPTGQHVVKTAHDVTLEVTPRIAEKIEVAQTLGTLSLSLRALADTQSDLDVAIANDAAKLTPGTAGSRGAKPFPLIVAPPIEGATSYSTGGDVSRFARRTLPPAAPVNANPSLGPTMPAIPRGSGVRVVRGNATASDQAGGGNTASQGSAMIIGSSNAAPLPQRPAGGE